MKKWLSLTLAVLMLLSLFACSKSGAVKCPNCGTERIGDAVFCGSCGTRFESLVVCKGCGHENDAKNKFCAACGSALTDSTQESISGGNGSTTEKDIWLKTMEVDPTGFTTLYFYDSNGYLLAKRMSYTKTGEFYGIFEYTNDSNGKPTRLQITYARSNALGSYNSHYESTYQYDANGLLTSVTTHAGTTTLYAYDQEGRLISKVSGGSEIKYSYNEDGKLSCEITYYNGKANQKDEYHYDADGNLSKKIVSLLDVTTVAPSYDVTTVASTHEVITVEPGYDVTIFEPESTFELGYTNVTTEAESYTFELGYTNVTTEAESYTFELGYDVTTVEPESTFELGYDVTTVEPESTVEPNPTGPVREYTYVCDKNGNIISMTETDYNTGGSKTTTYEYLSLTQYCQTGKAGQLPEEAGQFPDHIGRAGCDYCAGHGNDHCVGHICPSCKGQGYFTCAGCHGTGKGYMINGSNTCRVCYGSGKQICPNCDGAQKLFYN